MKSYHRYTIEGWMLTELGLDGSELILYAILYQLTKHEPKRWNYTHLAKYTGIPYRSIRRFMADLRDRGLLIIEKKPFTDSFVFRAVHQTSIVIDPAILAEDYLPTPVVGQNDQVDGQNGQVVSQNGQVVDQNAEKESTKEKEENVSSKRFFSSKDGAFEEEKKKDFVSWEEVLAYAHSRLITDNQAELFFSYYSANGWMIGQNPMKNWKAALACWVRNPKSKTPTAQATPEDYKARAEYLRQQSILEDQRREQEIAEARTPEARAAAEEFFKKFAK